MKRIGIISDTHSYWDDKYAHYFKDCDEIWHAKPVPVRLPEDVEV